MRRAKTKPSIFGNPNDPALSAAPTIVVGGRIEEPRQPVKAKPRKMKTPKQSS